jgi:hypothetical protein
VPDQAFSILLSHTPEIYRQAAHAGFNLLLSGHTHGGQICLPGSIPLTLDSVLPRRLGSGAWEYHDMIGYTSVGVGSSIVAVRLNCPIASTGVQLVNEQRLKGPIAQSQAGEDRGKYDRPYCEDRDTNQDVERRQWQECGASKQRCQRLGYLVEAGGSTAWRQIEAALKKS